MRRKEIIVGSAVGLFVLVFAYLRHSVSTDTLLLILAVVPSVILHEVTHGYVALAFGDPTAKEAGRLSLNPVRHIDLFGTILLPLVLVLMGVTPIGFAKPVPVNMARMRSPRNQGLIVSLAGPAMNILISVGAGILLRSYLLAEIANAHSNASALGTSMFVRYLFYLGTINLTLGVFNLIPIPPLDGSAILERFLPERSWHSYLRVRQLALPVLLFLFLFFPSTFGSVIRPFANFWANTFLPL